MEGRAVRQPVPETVGLIGKDRLEPVRTDLVGTRSLQTAWQTRSAAMFLRVRRMHYFKPLRFPSRATMDPFMSSFTSIVQSIPRLAVLIGARFAWRNGANVSRRGIAWFP